MTKGDILLLILGIFSISLVIGWTIFDMENYLFPSQERSLFAVELNASFVEMVYTNTIYPETHNVTFSKKGNITEILIDHPCIAIKTGKGNSMRPFIKYKDLTIVDNCPDPSTLDIGDIIAFNVGTMYFHHRIIKINHAERWFVTQGDNNEFDDGRIPFSRLVSRTIGFLNIYEDHEGNSWKESP